MPRDSVLAADTGLPSVTRRILLMGAPAVALLPIGIAACQPVQAAVTDPHLAWLDQWRTAMGSWPEALDDHGGETPQSDALWEERDRLSALIQGTHAETTEGVRAQIAWVIEDSRGEFINERHMAALALAMGALK